MPKSTPSTRPVYRTEREFNRLAAIETDDHILWPFSCRASGHGIATVEGKLVRVHRLALERRTGPMPTSVLACHAPLIGCSPNCMNYRHLRWGSKRDNAADAILDGRIRRGEAHPLHRLTADEVREIRKRRAAGARYKALAVEYGVSWLTVKAAAKRLTWAWLD